MSTNLKARFRAIETLQRLRSTHATGSARFDEIDHAIDLALQPRRAVDAYLVRNVLRDAERVIRRRRRRQRLILEANLCPDAWDGESAQSLAETLPDYSSPEAELAAVQITSQAVVRDTLPTRSARVLECLVDGCTTREIAESIGISPAHASTLSRRVRAAVRAATTTTP